MNIFPFIILSVRTKLMEPESELGNVQLTGGRWSESEHRQFLIGVVLYGKDWIKIQQLVKTRTGPQVRSHAQKFFLKLRKLCRQHRKCRTREILKLSSLQSEISAMFTEKDITEHTPPEFKAVIKKDWSILIPRKKRYRKGRAVKIEVDHHLMGQYDGKNKFAQQESSKMDFQSEKVFMGQFEERLQEQEKQSYFIQLLKYNKKNCLEDDLLLDFSVISEQQVPSCNTSKQYSFILPNKEENSVKLIQRLDTLHKAIYHKNKAFQNNLTI